MGAPEPAPCTWAPIWKGPGEASPNWLPAVDDAVDILEAELAEGDVVLVKASRSAGLERVALRLIADLGTADLGRYQRRHPAARRMAAR